MPKIPECDRCQRYSDNLHLACTIHPTGPDTGECLAFAPNADAMASGLSEAMAEELTEPVGASYYAGELVAGSHKRLSRQEQLKLLETHPLFTGQCPKCGHAVNKQNQFPSK